MAKVDIDLTRAVALRQPNWTAGQVTNFIADLKGEAANQAAEEQKEPAQKKQYVVIVNDPLGKIKASGDYSGWVVQIAEDDAPHSVLDKISESIRDFNRTPRGRRQPINTVADACEFGPASIFKERKLWIKTKEPILIVCTSGQI